MKRVKVNTPVPTWKTVNTNSLYDGVILFEMGNTRIIISELELDYDGCYYEGDQPQIRGKIETQILS